MTMRPGCFVTVAAALFTLSCSGPRTPSGAGDASVDMHLDLSLVDASTRDGADLPDGEVGGSCLPPCLRVLLEGCLPAGGCMSALEPDGRSQRLCYGNGLRATRLVGAGDAGTGGLHGSVSQGATTCYDYDRPDRVGATITITFVAPDGQPVLLRGTMGDGGATYTVECDGATHSLPPTPACNAYLYDHTLYMTSSCPPGACPP